ncbi:MAG: BON domain-containing protein [Burkholderiales bacterium]|nr:BON domain-containing protein [Burkholderiales bacterium]
MLSRNFSRSYGRAALVTALVAALVAALAGAIAVAGPASAATTSEVDAAITASVKAELARDAELNTHRIEVATREGRVSLRGTAPNAVARDRAARLAATVEGVRSVDNQLLLNSSSSSG